MTKVLVLGASGMLGSAVLREFSDFDGQVFASLRPGARFAEIDGISIREFDAENDLFSKVAHDFGSDDFVINCIGLVKARIDESEHESVLRAIKLNALLPHEIQEFAARSGVKVLQIATDCVFSGTKGNYTETDPHDPLDVYGKTKSLGEVQSQNFMNLRTSILGPEISGHTSLYDWVKLQPPNAEINGFLDHIWNGVTTKAFARIARGIIENGSFGAGMHHVTPSDKVPKARLVSEIAAGLGRVDLKINPINTSSAVDRSLKTNNQDINQKLWRDAGYPEVPSIPELLAEIAN